MLTRLKRPGLAVLASAACFGLGAATAQAQFGSNAIVNPFARRALPPTSFVYPDIRVQQAAANIAVLGKAYTAVPPYALGFNPYVRPVVPPLGPAPFAGSPYASLAAAYSLDPYAGANSFTSSLGTGGYGSLYPYSSYEDPVAGYLRGAAGVISSQNQFQIGRQQAALLREQALQARLDTRRRIFEEWLYERANTPTMQQMREEAQALELRRSQINPTVTEVLSGKALNDLLEHAARLQAKGVRGPSVPIDADNLKRLNLTTLEGGNVGILKNNGELTWPQALMAAPFEEDRKLLNRTAPEAVQQAKFGKVDPGTLSDMSNAVERLRTRLTRDVFDLPPTQYIEATRFLRQLENALKVLKSPNAANFFTDKYAARGKSAAELVQFMAANGLRFAPAVEGDEAAYTAVHHALASYDLALQAQAPQEAAPAGAAANQGEQAQNPGDR